jgi:hypothetical protein
MSRYSLGQVVQADGASPVYVVWDSHRRQVVFRTDRWIEVLTRLGRLEDPGRASARAERWAAVRPDQVPPEPENPRQR